MECPHCHQEVPTITCPQCGRVTPEGANYCMWCGIALAPVAESELEQEDFFDPDERVLCPDGTCTGIIIDGRCTECGRSLDASSGQEDEGGATPCTS